MNNKILIVEDISVVMRILKTEIEELGCRPILARNGREGVDMAAAKLPNLIMMDINMPEMDGFEATRLIRENPRTRSIPIMAVTASKNIKDKQKCLNSGFDDYLSKPFTPSQLASHIETLLTQPATIP